MKVKDLIKKLKQFDQEAEVVSKEYQGWAHAIHAVEDVCAFSQGEFCDFYENHSSTEVVCKKTGKVKTNIVYIN